MRKNEIRLSVESPASHPGNETLTDPSNVAQILFDRGARMLSQARMLGKKFALVSAYEPIRMGYNYGDVVATPEKIVEIRQKLYDLILKEKNTEKYYNFSVFQRVDEIDYPIGPDGRRISVPMMFNEHDATFLAWRANGYMKRNVVV